MQPVTDTRKYLDPQVISRLSRLDLVARLVVEGFITGLHRSPYHGFSVEFSEYRPYMPGDPLKIIDWKVLGRTDRYYVKQFEEETNLKAYLLVDASGSMKYASGGLTKSRYAVLLSAALTYLMLLQRDAVGLAVFDDRVRTYLPPRSMAQTLNVILRELDRLACGGDTDIAAIFHSMAERIQRRGLVIVLSDLLDDPENVLRSLKHFRHKKHEVIVFHILDPDEMRLRFDRETVFVDLETGEELQTRPWRVRDSYEKTVAGWMKRIRLECRQHRIDYVPMDTSTSFADALFRYLVVRKRMGG
jgi:uncharacterized protein (DUF58 family)